MQKLIVLLISHFVVNIKYKDIQLWNISMLVMLKIIMLEDQEVILKNSLIEKLSNIHHQKIWQKWQLKVFLKIIVLIMMVFVLLHFYLILKIVVKNKEKNMLKNLKNYGKVVEVNHLTFYGFKVVIIMIWNKPFN